MENQDQFASLCDENNHDNLSLQDENGNVIEFKQVALLPYNGAEREEPTMYALLHPMVKDIEDNVVVCYRVEVNDDDYELIEEENDAILHDLFDQYMELVKKSSQPK